MSRDLTAGAITASQAEVVRPVNMVELDFSGGFVRANSTPMTISYDGNDYLGVGNLGSIAIVEEGTDLKARGIRLGLTGIPPAMVSLTMNEYYQGRSCKIYLGLLDSDHVLIADPVLLGEFRMDTMDIALGDTASITVTAESVLADWDRARARRYTHEDQLTEYPTDKGFQFISKVTNKDIVWGKAYWTYWYPGVH